MNPLTFVSKFSTENNDSCVAGSPELVALFVFSSLYVIVRVVEIYLIPIIPEKFTRELRALFRWGPIIVPVIFGISYFSCKEKKKGSPYNDQVLKERMMAFTTSFKSHKKIP